MPRVCAQIRTDQPRCVGAPVSREIDLPAQLPRSPRRAHRFPRLSPTTSLAPFIPLNYWRKKTANESQHLPSPKGPFPHQALSLATSLSFRLLSNPRPPAQDTCEIVAASPVFTVLTSLFLLFTLFPSHLGNDDQRRRNHRRQYARVILYHS